MITPEQQQRFVELRARGLSFDKIATEMGVSRRCLINWSRKLQFEIQNERALALEALQHDCIATPEERARFAGNQLQRVLHELQNRDLSRLSTSRLFSLADSFRRQVIQETGHVRFSTPVREIPQNERVDRVQDWTA
jgi:transposase